MKKVILNKKLSYGAHRGDSLVYFIKNDNHTTIR